MLYAYTAYWFVETRAEYISYDFHSRELTLLL